MALIRRLLAVSIYAALVALARTASAQPATFVQALSQFNAAVAGTYGDEGARVGPALDTMAAALAQWDRELEELEAKVASQLRGATPAVTMRLRTELAARFVERG